MNRGFNYNPVKATLKAVEQDRCDLADVNNVCYGICAAFSGTSDPWSINQDCALQCEKLVEQVKENQLGVGYCDHRPPRRPVIWSTTRFFPDIYDKLRNKKQALALCIEKCKGCEFPEQCKEHCMIDSFAVEDEKSVVENTKTTVDFKTYEKAHPMAFWIGAIIAIIIMTIAMVILVRTIVA